MHSFDCGKITSFFGRNDNLTFACYPRMLEHAAKAGPLEPGEKD